MNIRSIVERVFCNIDSKFKVKPKTNPCFSWIFFCLIHPTSSYNSRKCHQIIFFLSENDIFTLSPSSSSSNYKIVIVINTPTTMNNQFETFNAPKIDLHSLFLTCYELKTTSLSLCLHIHPKNSSFWFKIFYGW